MLMLIHFVHDHHHQVYNWWEEVRRCWASPAAQSLAATCEQRRQTLLSPSLLFSAASIFTSQSSASNTNTNKRAQTHAIPYLSWSPPPSPHLLASPLSSIPHSNLNLCHTRKKWSQRSIFPLLFHFALIKWRPATSQNKWMSFAPDCCFFGGRNVAWLSKWNG